MLPVYVLQSVFQKIKLNKTHSKWLNDTKEVLSLNPYAGEKVTRRLTPRYYRYTFKVLFVYRYEAPQAHRFIYTLDTKKGEPVGVRIIDFLNHKEYERMFKY